MDVDSAGKGLTSDDFIDFLDEKCSDSVCVGCLGERFTIIADDRRACLFRSAVRNLEKPSSMPFYGVFCQNCGTLRYHAAVVVDRWAAGREESRQGELLDESND
ncbi:hypothetical protein [Pseudomonas sp. 3A(2025)]